MQNHMVKFLKFSQLYLWHKLEGKADFSKWVTFLKVSALDASCLFLVLYYCDFLLGIATINAKMNGHSIKYRILTEVISTFRILFPSHPQYNFYFSFKMFVIWCELDLLECSSFSTFWLRVYDDITVIYIQCVISVVSSVKYFHNYASFGSSLGTFSHLFNEHVLLLGLWDGHMLEKLIACS